MSNKWIAFVFVTFLQRFATFATDENDADTFVRFYDENNNLHLIHLAVPEVYGTDLEIRLSVDVDTRFMLYTRDNINYFEELYIDLRNVTYYDPSKPLIILTHGWLGSGYSNSTQSLKNAYLAVRDVNVIIVDWKEAASYEYYLKSAFLTNGVAKKLRNMIVALSKTFMINGRNMHFVGHSLGAHVVGLAGIKLRHSKFYVERVTGLDPARPFFEFPAFFPAITKQAANFVDIIHTDAGILGYLSSVGHADFYPNGGINQPYCCSDQETSCEHKCAYVYLEEAIREKMYLFTKCDSYFGYLTGLCDYNDKELLALPRETARGDYYLTIY